MQPRPAPLDEMPDLPEVTEPTSPGGAFLRAVALPGWGHASIGAYRRAGFYFVAEAGTTWMLFRTAWRRGSAEERRDFRERTVRDELAAEGVTDETEIQAALDADEEFESLQGLVDARGQQFEDWLALGVFLVFLSGADAFVSAHLADFPEPITVASGAAPGSLEVGLSLPLGGGR